MFSFIMFILKFVYNAQLLYIDVHRPHYHQRLPHHDSVCDVTVLILRNHWFTQNRTLPRRGFLHEKFDDR